MRHNTTDAPLAMVPTQRGLLKARVLTVEDEQLMTQLDELLELNHRVAQGNPVRSVVDLLADGNKSDQHPNTEAARKFLTAKIEQPADRIVPEKSAAVTKPRRAKTKG